MTCCLNAFLQEYPEFSEINGLVVKRVGETEDKIVSDFSFGDLRCHALFLRTAHRLALRFNIRNVLRENGLKNTTNSAITTSKSASNASLSESSELNAFARSENPIWADFGRTQYGLEYLRLLEETMQHGNVILSRDVSDVYC